MRLRLLTALCIFSFFIPIVTADETTQPVVLSLPGLDWALQIGAPDFSLEEFEIAPPGNAARFQAINKETDIMMSGFLEKAPQSGNAQNCRDYYWARALESPFPKTKIRMSQQGSMATVTYLVESSLGQELNQKNLNAYLAVQDYWMDIHLSRTADDPEDQRLFEDVLKSISIQKNYNPDSRLLFQFGNVFYCQKRYSEAVPYYRQALNLEKTTETMPRESWFILVDHLGISYGLSGNIKKAKEIYIAAISKAPEYPMFYYNLACAFAESGNLDKAITNLKLAHQYRKNMLPGKRLPSPRTDPSFRKFLNSNLFAEALNQMKWSPNES